VKTADLLVMLAATQALQVASTAHPITRFDACGKPSGLEGERCDGKTEVGQGVRVVIRAELGPPHVGASAWASRLRPHADRWERVAQTHVLEGGNVRWHWTPKERHIHNYTAWRFRFHILGHGRSDIARVLVRSDEF